MSAGQVRSRRGRRSARHAMVGSMHNSAPVKMASPPGGGRWTLKAALLASAAGVMLAPGAASALDPNALPTGGQVTSGNAGISSSGSTMNVTQSSQKAIINWGTFNIGQQAAVTFQQPNAASIALNRVGAGPASDIEGHLNANGQVFLINPSGITFGAGAQVNVGGLVASTMDIADQDFLNGTYAFKRHGSTGTILNQGTVTAGDGGYIGFLAPNVVNQGNLVTGRFGSVVLAAGRKVTLTFDDNGTSLVSAQVDPTKVQTLIENHNLITAPDGRVIMSAQAASALMGSTINNSGIIEADSLTSKGGVVTLEASNITNSGTIAASGATQSGAGDGGTIRLVSLDTTTVGGSLIARGGVDGGNGGTIETSGNHVVYGGAFIDTRAPHGTAGNWLVDPYDFTITDGGTSGQDTISNTDLDNALLTSNVTLSTRGSAGDGNGNGDIFVNGNVYWYSPYGLTLNAFRDIDVNANITHVGSGGALALNPNTGGAGGMLNIADGYTVTLNPDAAFSISGTQYTLITTAAQLQSVANNLGGDYAVANDLDLTGFGFAPLGGSSTPFAGVFEGLGHAIGNLTLNMPSASYVGLFGVNAGTINDIHLSAESVTGGSYAGGLAGYNYGRIANSSVQGTIAGSGTSSAAIGGLVGCNCVAFGSVPSPIGTITGSFALTTVTAGDGANMVGGFVGSNEGVISASYTIGTVTTGTRSANIGGFVGSNAAAQAAGAPSTISNAFAQDTVAVGSASINIGGFAGGNVGAISGSYARGTLTAGDGSALVGGLVGYNSTAGQGFGGVIDSTSAVMSLTVGTAGSKIGGLVGYNAGTITNSFSAGTVTAGDGSTDVGGLVGHNDGRGGPASITNSYSLASVHAGNNSTNVGGFVGLNSGLISADYASTMTVISGYSSQSVGGMVGLNDIGGIIDHTYDYGYNNLVSVGSGSSDIGGLAGSNSGSIGNGSYSTGTVMAGSLSSAIGGLVGTNNASGTIDDSWGVGTVTGTAAGEMGGLVGLDLGTISNSYSSITVGAADATAVGGLVGEIESGGLVTASYALGTVIGNTEVGGLVGRIETTGSSSGGGTVSGSYTQTSVTGVTDVGGLVGANYYGGVITGSHTYGGQVVGGGPAFSTTYSMNVGGLVGYSIGIIDTSYNTASVQAGGNARGVGGLVGVIGPSANGGVTSSYSTGSIVVGTNSSGIGGLVGDSGNILLFSYSTGSVTAGDDSIGVGGLAGSLTGGGSGYIGLVDTSHSTGNVSSGVASTDVGGLVGISTGTILDGWASATVTAGNAAQNVGGLVGQNYGTVNGGASFGQVVVGFTAQNVGGLVGAMRGSSAVVTNKSNANTNVTVGNSSNAIGSLIGLLQGGGSVSSDSTATGTVTAGPGSTNVGGQIGETSP